MTSAPGDPTTLYVVEQPGTIKIVRNGSVARHVPRHPQPGQERRRAGAALGRVPPALRDEPPLLRRLHRHERRHARRRVPLVERRRRSPATRAPAALRRRSRTPNHNGGQLEFDAQRATSTSAWATAAPAATRRTARRTSEPRSASCCASTRRAPADVADRRLRPAQPVALLVRPQDRRPLDRRRRPGQLGGGRLPHRGERRRARELRLEPLRGEVGLRRREAATCAGRR